MLTIRIAALVVVATAVLSVPAGATVVPDLRSPDTRDSVSLVRQDLRSPDATVPVTVVQDLRSPDARGPVSAAVPATRPASDSSAAGGGFDVELAVLLSVLALAGAATAARFVRRPGV